MRPDEVDATAEVAVGRAGSPVPLGWFPLSMGQERRQPRRASARSVDGHVLAERGVRVVDAADWDRLMREERLLGSRVGRAAVRRVDVPALLASLDEAAPLAGGP